MKSREADSAPEPPGITINGATFRVVTHRIWKIPNPGRELPIDLRLRVVNQGKTGLRFHWLDTVRVVLVGPDGKSLPLDGGRDGTGMGEVVSRLVMPGASLELSRPAKLIWIDKKRILRLTGSDGFGGVWYFDGLAPGKYQVKFTYVNDTARIAESGSVWLGKVITPPVEVVLQ